MATKNWFEKITSFRKDIPKTEQAPIVERVTQSLLENSNISKELEEIKATNDKLNKVVDDLRDTYDVKFLDTEPSGFNSHYSADFSGIDQQVDDGALQRIYSTETWVYSPVTTIAKDIAMLPWRLEKCFPIKKQVKNELTGQVEEIIQEIWSDVSGEKLFGVFKNPNPFCSKTEFLMMLMIDFLTTGHFYIYLDAAEGVDLSTIADLDRSDSTPDSAFGRLQSAMTAGVTIKGMYRIPPSLIKPVPSETGSYIEGYAMQSDKGTFGFNFAEVIHCKLPNPNDPYRGQSPLIAAFKSVLLDRFTTEHMVRFYKTGARLGGVIKTEKSLNKEQLGRFQRSFEDNFTGRKNHHRTLILPPGMSYQTIQQNPAETALLEFCKYNRESLLSVFQVPPIKVGLMDHANYANALVQLKQYFTDTIKPTLAFIEDAFSMKRSIFPAQNLYRLKFDLTGVEALKEDNAALAVMGTNMLKAGLTVNEVRKRVWQAEPLPKGDRAFSIAEIDKMENGQAGAMVLHSAPVGEAKDGLSTTNNPELIHTDVAGQHSGKCEKCKCEMVKEEGCKCPCHENGKGGKPSLAEYIADACAKLDPSEQVTPEFLSELVNLYNGILPEEHKEEAAPEVTTTVTPDQAATQGDIIAAPVVYAFGMSKDQVVEHWKTFIKKSEPLIEKRHAEVDKWFKKVKSHIASKLGLNVKAFGLHKARDQDDVNEILDPSDFEDLIKQYINEIDGALKEAFEQGYTDTLVDYVFDAPNADAIEFLKKYGADEVTSILDTTRDQMKTLLTDAFKEGVPVGEVSIRLQEKFDEISAGRAMTIARTETLSAVSAGQETKRQDFKKQFKDKKLMKSWVSAQDDKVRESHQDVDGESVGVDEEFSNGLKYPREQGGDAEDVINCRCTSIAFVEEDKDSVDEELDSIEDSDSEDSKE